MAVVKDQGRFPLCTFGLNLNFGLQRPSRWSTNRQWTVKFSITIIFYVNSQVWVSEAAGRDEVEREACRDVTQVSYRSLKKGLVLRNQEDCFIIFSRCVSIWWSFIRPVIFGGFKYSTKCKYIILVLMIYVRKQESLLHLLCSQEPLKQKGQNHGTLLSKCSRN